MDRKAITRFVTAFSLAAVGLVLFLGLLTGPQKWAYAAADRSASASGLASEPLSEPASEAVSENEAGAARSPVANPDHAPLASPEETRLLSNGGGVGGGSVITVCKPVSYTHLTLPTN